MDRETELTEFDFQQIYEEKIKPYMREIKKICKIEGIPFFYAFALKNTDDGDNRKTTYRYEANLTGCNNICLADDKFREFILVINGMKAERPGVITKDGFSDNLDYINDIPLSNEDEDAEDYNDVTNPSTNGIDDVGVI